MVKQSGQIGSENEQVLLAGIVQEVDEKKQEMVQCMD